MRPDGHMRAARALAAAAVVALAGACGRRGEAPAAAVRLLEARGTVEVERQGDWRAAQAGESLQAEEALRTGDASEAQLRFPDGARLRLQERTLIRLGQAAGTSLLFHVELGQLEVEADAGTTLATATGEARLTPGTRLRIRIDGARTRYEVQVGQARFEAAGGGLQLAAGEGLALALGSAEVERYRAEFGAPEIEVVPLAGARGGAADRAKAGRDRGARAGEAASGASPGAGGEGAAVEAATTAADVALPAGESAAIHSLRTPVLVRLQLPAACTDAAVELSGSSRRRLRPAAGADHVLLSLGAGTHRYRSRCGDSTGAAGTLAVRRDGSTGRLPGRAPSNTIDADGHRYIIHYQNRLPSLTLSWPDPPASARYTLNVQQRREVRRHDLKTAEQRLPEGALAEGDHSFWFTTAEGKTSPTTQVAIRFDNGATAAQILAPAEGKGDDGAGVEVAGVALVGSTVAVGATALATDEQGRFHGRVPSPPPEARALAIRLEHPASGVHYYIRRLRGH